MGILEHFTRHKRRYDFRFITYFTTVCSFLGFSPSYNWKQQKFCKCHVLLRLNAFALSFSLILSYFLTARRRYEFFLNAIVTQIVIDVLSTASTVFVNISAMMSVNFWNVNNHVKLLNGFLEVDEALNQHVTRKKTSNFGFYAEIISSQTLLLYNICTTIEVFIRIPGTAYVRHYITEHIIRYHAFIIVNLMYNYLLSLRYRFESLNESLGEVSFERLHLMDVPERFEKMIEVPKQFRSIMDLSLSISFKRIEKLFKIYVKLLDQVYLFNYLFGWIMFSIMLNVLTSILLLLYLALTTKIESKMNAVNIVNLIWTFMIMVNTIKYVEYFVQTRYCF